MEPWTYGKCYNISTTHLKYLVQRCAVITANMTSSISTVQTATPDPMAATLTEESVGAQWEMYYIASAAIILYTVYSYYTVLYYMHNVCITCTMLTVSVHHEFHSGCKHIIM